MHYLNMRLLPPVLLGLVIGILFWSLPACGESSGHQTTTPAVQAPAPPAPAKDARYLRGEEVYRTKCALCHRVNQKLVGPALAGVGERYAGEMDWLYAYIRNAPQMIKDGDPKAVALFEQYNKALMTAYPDLTDEEIGDLLYYIEAETE